MNSKILTVGDEILIGQIVNTNAAYLGDALFSLGMPVEKSVTIGDDEKMILDEFKDSLEKYDLTIITGGLGPTHDDITKPALVKFFNDELILNEKILDYVTKLFASRNIIMPKVNEGQAMVPSKSKVIWNANGTAPGIWMEQENKVFVALPGVPYEMKAMMEESVVPMLKEKFLSNLDYVLKQKTLLTTGVGESVLNEMIGDVQSIIKNDKLAFLPSIEGVRLRINVKSDTEENADKRISEIENQIREKIGEYIFGTGNDILEEITGKLLTQKKLTLAAAESCTGGLLSSRITDVSGSSAYFLGGIVSYANEAKIEFLNVKEDTLKNYGAVSEQTAIEMAENVRRNFNSDIGISTTGIAGPTGGTAEKPVGLVYIGYSDKEKTYAKQFLFSAFRERNKKRAAQEALEILRKELLQK
ncbi:MAG: competence/damage-inducible protein A [Ignavibacteria bacterium]|nr:competence/damage-inducible protein A [Ignavibacteria bacterium]